MAAFVLGVGAKLAEAFQKHLGFCKGHTELFLSPLLVFLMTFPMVSKFLLRKEPSVLVFGRGDAENFKLKGFDFAARCIAALSETVLVFVRAPNEKH